ncbi:hypothetical protein AB0K16_16840 [Nonomuraea jabiensis]|uniref:hypothetical protein n=1 Tax=Nonomuraea jabiensis TaxID=882448 RepID=UPI00341736AA
MCFPNDHHRRCTCTWSSPIPGDPGQAVFRAIRGAWPGTLIANPALPWPGPLPADGCRSAGKRLLSAGADLIARGRAFLANPHLVERLRVNAPLNEVRDRHLMCVGGPIGYTAYSSLTPAAA